MENIIVKIQNILEGIIRDNESYRDRLKPKICNISHSMYYCVQVLYTTNQQTAVFRVIKDSFGYATQID